MNDGWKVIHQPLRAVTLRHVCKGPNLIGHVNDVRMVDVNSIGQDIPPSYNMQETRIAYLHLPDGVGCAMTACPKCWTMWVYPYEEKP